MTCEFYGIDIGSQVPGRLQTDDSSLLTPHIYTVGAQFGCKLVKTVDTVIGWSQVSLILLAITCENSGRSCTGRKSVVNHHKSVGGRSQVYNDGRALVGGATTRVSCR